MQVKFRHDGSIPSHVTEGLKMTKKSTFMVFRPKFKNIRFITHIYGILMVNYIMSYKKLITKFLRNPLLSKKKK